MTIDQHGIDQHGSDLQTAARDVDAGALRQSLIERAGSPPRHPDEGRLIELLDAHDRFVVRRRRLVGSGAFFALVLLGASAAALAWHGKSDPTVPARPVTPVAPITDEPSSGAASTTSVLAVVSATTNAAATVGASAPARITPAEPASVVVGSIGTASGADATTPLNDENGASTIASRPTEPGHPASTQGSVPPTVSSSVPDGSGPRPSASPSTIGAPSPTVKLPPGPAATAPVNDEPTLPPNARR